MKALISNSATFEAKTEFAQDKYKKKKAKKYVQQVTLRRPNGRTVCEVRQGGGCACLSGAGREAVWGGCKGGGTHCLGASTVSGCEKAWWGHALCWR